MTTVTTSPSPPGARDQENCTRWRAWFARYIDSMRAHQRRQRARRAWASLDSHSLADIGVSQAQRLIAVNTPPGEH